MGNDKPETNGNGATHALKGLPANVIAELMAGNTGRNTYGPKLKEFCDSDEAAINPREAWPLEFGKKSAGAMLQSFNSHVKSAKLEDVILVRKQGDEVFLLHKERCAIVTAAPAAE